MASPRPSPSNATRNHLACAIAVACLALPGMAAADTPAGAYVTLDDSLPGAADASEQRLFLEVFHGDRPIGLLAEFRLRGERLWATPQELTEIGLVLPAGVAPDDTGLVPLDGLPGLAWRYDAAAQRLHLTIPSALRPGQALGYRRPDAVRADRPPGWLVGYDAYGQHRENVDTLAVATAMSLFGRFGTFELDGVTQLADVVEGGSGRGFERLDTRWTYSDPQRLQTWTVGDLVSGGLAWTRPVRMGGVQWRRNFATRPDLVTIPLPRFSADATLPSAVELYVDNVRQFGSEIQDGPFVLDALPSINGAGMAQLVVRDSLGRVTTTSVALYVDNQRLAAGLTDFSVELGLLRRGFGGPDDEYGDEAAGSASWRRGATDTLTVEAHVEATRGLELAGAGAVWSPGNRLGLVNGAYARSRSDEGGDGWLRSLGYQYSSRHWGIEVQSQRRSVGFRDLGDASVAIDGTPTTLRADDRATLWAPTPAGSFALSWLRWEDRDGDRRSVRSLSWNRQFGTRVHVTATAFDDGDNRGGGITFSMPLARNRHASVTVQHSGSGTDTVASLRQSVPYEGGWGWGVQAGDRDGGQGRGWTDYRGAHVETTFGVEHDRRSTGVFAQARGSIVGIGGETFFARPIYDGFALVSTGVGGVPVLHENRLFGHTDADGHLLMTQLRGWQRNRIAIDPDLLPANYRVGDIERFATPTDHGGVVVDFDVRRLAPALAVLLARDGKPVAAGSRATADGTHNLIVGFDGEVYLESLDRDTVLETDVEGGICRHVLPASPANTDGSPVRIGPVACQWRPR